MLSPRPEYKLFTESVHESWGCGVSEASGCGRWKFVLEAMDGTSRIDASDEEEDVTCDRLELLAVVRGLEALPSPSRVTLATGSRYVTRGLRFGLAEWRESGWQWERFGQMTPVSNADLWQRLDRALQFHEVHFRTLRFDAPHPVQSRSDRRASRARLERPSRSIEGAGRANRTLEVVRRWFGRTQVRAAQLL